jgi:hypothetical protein
MSRRNSRATYLNGLAIATFAVGALAPIVAVLSSGVPPEHPWIMFGLITICLAASGVLHSGARRLLNGLMP